MYRNFACRAVKDMDDAVVIEPNGDSAWGREYNYSLLKFNRFRVIDFKESAVARFQSECVKRPSFQQSVHNCLESVCGHGRSRLL